MGAWKSPSPLSRLASGIEAGVIGGLAMLGFMVVGSLLRGRVWWEVPNLLGSTFYGARALRYGPGLATVTGAAFHFTITGLLGACFGLACGTIERRRRLLLVGLSAGLLWHFFAEAVFWPHVNPLVPLYASTAVFLPAHLLYGACLGFRGQGPAPDQAEAKPPRDGVE